MKIHKIKLTEPSEIHKIFDCYKPNPPTGWWYRGQADEAWPLIPKAGRKEFMCSENAFGRFNAWSKNATIFSDIPSNDWQRLATAQHHGLATCLLDWTYNPLVSVFFACNQMKNKDGAIYIYEPPSYVDDKVMQFEFFDDLTKDHLFGYIPQAVSRRMVNQKGVFTVHLPVDKEPPIDNRFPSSEHPNLVKIIINKNMKQPLLNLIRNYGIDDSILFPDLDGLSREINEQTIIITTEKT